MLRDRGCWWQNRPKPSPTSQSCRQHISSPTSVTNIDVALIHVSQKCRQYLNSTTKNKSLTWRCNQHHQTCPNQVLSNESSPESRPDVYPESWVKSWQEIQDQSQDMKKKFFRGLDISLEFLVKTWVKTWDMSRDSILIFRISKVYNRQYRLRIKAVFKLRVDGLVS